MLVDRFSASASEIFAAAIQDYHRGIILGQRTFGKGTVQNLVPLDRWSARPVNGQLTVTIGKFYRHHRREHSACAASSPMCSAVGKVDIDEVGESALDCGAAVGPHRRRAISRRRATRALRSTDARESTRTTRAQHDPDYRWLIADIAAIDTIREQKTVSLNLNARREERVHEDHDRLERENERRAAKGQPPIKNVEELDKADTLTSVLTQAAEIMADMVTGVRTVPTPAPAPGRETARRG